MVRSVFSGILENASIQRTFEVIELTHYLDWRFFDWLDTSLGQLFFPLKEDWIVFSLKFLLCAFFLNSNNAKKITFQWTNARPQIAAIVCIFLDTKNFRRCSVLYVF